MKPHIIGISGNMGAGKSTLATELAKKLGASVLHWDDFDDISNGPEDYVDWYERGENYYEWNYQALADVLQYLQSGKATVHPISRQELQPTNYIVFDAPLGRFHKQTGKYIDTWIHLDVPLDVSLCRWLLREYKAIDKSKEALLDELEFYLHKSRPLFEDSKYKTEADLLMDGMLTTTTQVQSIEKYLERIRE